MKKLLLALLCCSCVLADEPVPPQDKVVEPIPKVHPGDAFGKALTEIVQRHPAVHEAIAEVQATKDRNRSAELHWLPSLDLNARYDEDKTLGATNVDTTMTAQARATVNLFRFGADAARLESAKAEIGSAEYLYVNSLLVAEREGIAALLNFLDAHKTAEVRKKVSDMRKLALQIAQKRFKKGLLSRQEVQKIRVDYENSMAQLSTQTTRAKEVTAKLHELLGHTQVPVRWPWLTELIKARVSHLDGFSIEKHPKWIAAQKNVEKAEADKKESWRKMLPSLDATGAVGYKRNQDRNIDGNIWSAGVQLSIPVFNRLEDYGNYRAEIQEKIKSEAQYEIVKREIRGSYQASKNSYKITLESARARMSTLATSKNLYEVNLKRFRRGLIDANDLIVDLNRLFDADLLAIQGWTEAHLKFTDLCHSVGQSVSKCLALSNAASANKNSAKP